jgi:hypothetical protein
MTIGVVRVAACAVGSEGSGDDDHVDLAVREFARERRQTIEHAFRPARLEDDIASLDVAMAVQRLAECRPGTRILAAEYADAVHARAGLRDGTPQRAGPREKQRPTRNDCSPFHRASAGCRPYGNTHSVLRAMRLAVNTTREGSPALAGVLRERRY